MHRNDDHLNERALLLAIDRELPPQEQRDADEHLSACDACRDRRRRIAQVSTTIARRLDSGRDDADAIRRVRARLTVRLAEAARHEPQPVAARMAGALQQLALPPAVVAAAAALLLVARIAGPAWSSRGSGSTAAVHDAALPIASLTPGATWTEAADELCAAAGRERRDIPAAVRDAVLRNYHMTTVSADDYELDYLITPELGGASDARNLWPQRYASGIWNAHVKDQLEDLLPALVCAGQVPLQSAQHDIADNWIAAYKRYFHTSVPLPTRVASSELGSPRGRRGVPEAIWRAPHAAALPFTAISAR